MSELSNNEFKISKDKVIGLVGIIIMVALFLRTIVALGYYSSYDTFWYRDWAVDLMNGFFDVYTRAEEISLDYPPLYLFCLFLTGTAYGFFGIECDAITQMFLMKFWPVLFDCIMIWMLWYIGSRYSVGKGLFAAFIWAFNPSVFFNTSMWGQTDQLMCLMLVCSFWFAETRKPIASCFLFALAGMTKFQCLYFTPVLLFLIFYRSGLVKLLKGIGVAAAMVVAVFLPFMIGSSDPLLFFNVYMGGADTYPYCTLNAFNLYGCFQLNWVDERASIIGIFTYSNLSTILLMFSIFGLIAMFVFGKRKCGFVAGLYFMQCIFMLTTRMHERYQIAVLPFALMAYLIHKQRRFLSLFFTLSVVTMLNQAMVLFNVNTNPIWEQNWDVVMQVFSWINLAIFVWSIYICIDFFFREQKLKQTETRISYDLHD